MTTPKWLNSANPPYGADPTGADDCTDALQNWIDVLGGGVPGYLPAGRYLISQPLVIQNSGTIILGDGGATASGDDAGKVVGSVLVVGGPGSPIPATPTARPGRSC